MKIPPEAPALASASVSLNTSVLYIGRAVGSAIGGVLYARDLLYGAGYVSMGLCRAGVHDGDADKAAAGSGAGPVMFRARMP
jgi:predicted MFS family arabinose efflux permease